MVMSLRQYKLKDLEKQRESTIFLKKKKLSDVFLRFQAKILSL
jgi:hypothetical protein